MARYIDADLIEYDDLIREDLDDVLTVAYWKDIKDMPIADVRENVNGEWIEEQNCYYRCSVCGKHYPSFRDNMEYNFCPNCGADMRGEANDKVHDRH